MEKRLPRRNWTAAEIALLGTDLDSVIAARLRRRIDGVAEKRRALGIPNHYRRRPWTGEEDAHLRAGESTTALAHALHRTPGSIQQRRIKLGIHVPPAWTAAQEALLGLHPDPEIARLTGHSLIAVRTRRRKLRLPCPPPAAIPCGHCHQPFLPRAGAMYCPACRPSLITAIKKKSRRKSLSTPAGLEKARLHYRRENLKRAENPAAAARARAGKKQQYTLTTTDPAALAARRTAATQRARTQQRARDLARLQSLLNSPPPPAP